MMTMIMMIIGLFMPERVWGQLPNEKDGALTRKFEQNPKSYRGPVLRAWLKFSLPL